MKVKLKAPTSLNIDFAPSVRQYEVWKSVQPECPKCGGKIEVEIDPDTNASVPVCSKCKNKNIPQIILEGGAAGGGKSYLGSCWLVSSCIRFPNIRAVVGRKTLKMLKESTLVTIFDKVMQPWGVNEDENYVYNSNEGVITFWNGSKIICKEMAATPSDPNFERFGSSEYTIAFVDEVSEISEKAIEVLFSRLRWNIASTFKTSKLLASTNPTTNWVRSRFVQDNDGNRVICKNGDAYIPFKVDDNPDKEFVAHYKSQLMKIRDTATRERLLEGNWDFIDVSDAAFYNGFDGNKHLVNKLREKVYDRDKPLILSFDFNVHPFMTCLVSQIDYENKKVYILEEVLGYPKDKRNNTPSLSAFVGDKYKRSKHEGGFVITGDPAGLSRSSQTKEGVNNFTIIMAALKKKLIGTSLRLLRKQPSQILRGEWINGILSENIDGWEILIDLRCRRLTEDLIYQLTNEDGTKDKSKIRDPKTGVKYEKYGHCFSGDTMVTTINGDIPIKDIKVGDLVMTSKGFKPVTFSGITGRGVFVKDYKINNRIITSTLDHPFYTVEDGFCEIDKIKTEKTFITNKKWKEKYTQLITTSSIDTQTLKDYQTENILKDGVLLRERKRRGTCIDIFGKNIMDQYQKDFIYTTKITTQGTTILKTLSVSYVGIIYQNMVNKLQKKYTIPGLKPLIKIEINQKHGIEANKGKIGIKNMHKHQYLEKKENLYVMSAGRCLEQKLKTKEQNIALINAEKELLQEILEKEKTTVTSNNKRKISKVYDITVADDHEFFANNVLVHNCSDAFDYFLCLLLRDSWYKYKRGGKEDVSIYTAPIAPTFTY